LADRVEICFWGNAIFVAAASVALAAQAKPGAGKWNGRRHLEAAKKEGQLAIYISGYEEKSPRFSKGIPGHQSGADHRSRVTSRPTLARGAARR
jgi:hypothetical protein